MEPQVLYVGIDVASKEHQVFIRPTGKQMAVANTPAGIDSLVATLSALKPALIVVEATGGLDVPLVWALHGAAELIAPSLTERYWVSGSYVDQARQEIQAQAAAIRLGPSR